jgi:hypothetical protein
VSKIERYQVEYQCDQCPTRVLSFDQGYPPMPAEPKSLPPTGWFWVRGVQRDPAHLCSATCLQAWAREQGGEGG